MSGRLRRFSAGGKNARLLVVSWGTEVQCPAVQEAAPTGEELQLLAAGRVRASLACGWDWALGTGVAGTDPGSQRCWKRLGSVTSVEQSGGGLRDPPLIMHHPGCQATAPACAD